MSDPEISTVDFSEDKLASNTETEHAPAWFEISRWPDASSRPPEFFAAPRRKRAIRDKRAFDAFRKTTPLKKLMTGEEFAIRLGNGGDLVARIEWHELSRAIAMSVLLACRAAHRRLVLAIASAMRYGGYLGVAATHDELAKVVELSPRHTRRVVRDLVELELLLEPVPLFVRYGCASSQRGNAYRVAPLVFGAVDVARAQRPVSTPMAVHAARTEMASHPDTNSGVFAPLPKDREALQRMAGHMGQIDGSAAPTGRFAGALPVSADDAGRCTRQAEVASSAPEAPERAGLDDIAAARELLAQLLIGGAA